MIVDDDHDQRAIWKPDPKPIVWHYWVGGSALLVGVLFWAVIFIRGIG